MRRSQRWLRRSPTERFEEATMSTLRTINTAAVLALTFGACAQMPGSTAAAPPVSAERMTAMDAHMKSRREMHDKMSRTRTPEERQALMAEHMKLMHDGIAMMGGLHGWARRQPRSSAAFTPPRTASVSRPSSAERRAREAIEAPFTSANSCLGAFAGEFLGELRQAFGAGAC
jgi:hypothetical protein